MTQFWKTWLGAWEQAQLAKAERQIALYHPALAEKIAARWNSQSLPANDNGSFAPTQSKDAA